MITQIKIPKILFAISLIVILLGCDKDNLDVITKHDVLYTPQVSESVETREIRPMIMGEQMKNPFSVENMQIALDFLKKQHVDTLVNAGIILDLLEKIEIYTTDLYVRIQPIDSVSYDNLMKDSLLVLFDYPLDYKIKQYGDYIEKTTDEALSMVDNIPAFREILSYLQNNEVDSINIIMQDYEF